MALDQPKKIGKEWLEAHVNLGICSVFLGAWANDADVRTIFRQRTEDIVVVTWKVGALKYRDTKKKRDLTKDVRLAVIQTLFKEELQEEGWEMHWFNDVLGAILYKTRSVRKFNILSRINIGEFNITTFQVEPIGRSWAKETPCAVAGGALFRQVARLNEHTDASELYAHSYISWPKEYCDKFRQRIFEDRVQFFSGFFEAYPDQLGQLLRSCGASGQRPIMQTFKEENTGAYLALPHYIVFFGPAEVRVANNERQPSRPTWLKIPETKPGPSWEATFRLNEEDLPQWTPLNQKELAKIGIDGWPHLHRVTSRAADIDHWKPHVHFVKAWINQQGRPCGKGSQMNRNKRRREEKNRLPQLREPQELRERESRGSVKKEEKKEEKKEVKKEEKKEEKQSENESADSD